MLYSVEQITSLYHRVLISESDYSDRNDMEGENLHLDRLAFTVKIHDNFIFKDSLEY